jgi:rhodanese-related sulfurtransferase
MSSTPPPDPNTPPPNSLSIDEILAEARSHLTRLTPAEAAAELAEYQSQLQSQAQSQSQSLSHPTSPSASQPPPAPTLLIDIRPIPQRLAHGTITSALPIERNVLEWRLDPRSSARLPVADRFDLRVIVICQEGYTSSLAARELQRLGLGRATDVVGGVRAWAEGGTEGWVEGRGKGV